MIAQMMRVTFLDGDYSGRICVNFDHISGFVYKIPKDKISACKNLDCINHSGIYLLCGDKNEAHPKIYIGQATQRQNNESVLSRLNEHLKDESRAFFKEVVFITNKTNDLTEDKLCYLENTFWDLASKAGSFEVTNGKRPSSLGSSDAISMQKLVLDVKIVMQLFGYAVFEPATNTKHASPTSSCKAPVAQPAALQIAVAQKFSSNQAPVSNSYGSIRQTQPKAKPPLTKETRAKGKPSAKHQPVVETQEVYVHNKTYHALMRFAELRFKAYVIVLAPNLPMEQFKRCFISCGSKGYPDEQSLITKALINQDHETILLKGGFVSSKEAPNYSPNLLKFRSMLLEAGYLEPFNQHLYQLKVDLLFESPSTAGTLVKGHEINGRVTWIISDTTKKLDTWLK